jgi:hypothetical protein
MWRLGNSENHLNFFEILKFEFRQLKKEKRKRKRKRLTSSPKRKGREFEGCEGGAVMGPRSCLFPLFLIIILLLLIIINAPDCYLYSHMRCALDSPRVEFKRTKARAHHGRVSCVDGESCAHHLPRVMFSFVYSSIPRTVVYWTTCRHITFQDFYF